MPRSPISPATLRRRALVSKKKNDRRKPKRRTIRESLPDFQTKEPSDWTAMDALACYADAYETAYGSPDASLRTEAGRVRAASILRPLLDELHEEDESPAEYIPWAVGHCRRGRGWPSDRTCSVYLLIYDRILLKKWRGRRLGAGASAATRRSSNRTFREVED